MKRFIYPLLIILCVGFVGYVYWTFRSEEGLSADVRQVLPSSLWAMVKVEGEAGQDALMDFGSAQATEAEGVMAPLWSAQVEKLRATAKLFDAVQQSVSVNGLCVGTTQTVGANEWFIVVGLTKDFPAEQVMDFAEKWSGASSTSADYKGEEVFTSKGKFFVVVNDCLIIASKESIVQDIISDIENEKTIDHSSTFADAWNSMAHDVPIHFFASDENGGWYALDKTATAPEYMGFYFTPDSIKTVSDLTGDKGRSNVENILPYFTSGVQVFSNEAGEEAWAKGEAYFEGSPAQTFWSQTWSDFGDSCQCDLNEAMISWRSGNYGTAQVELPSGRHWVGFVSVEDSTNALSLMRPLLKETSSTDGIYSFKYPDLWQRNFLMPGGLKANYTGQKGNLLFFAESRETLAAILQTTGKCIEALDVNTALNHLNPRGGQWLFQRKGTDYGSLPNSLKAIIGNVPFVAMNALPQSKGKSLVRILTGLVEVKQPAVPIVEAQPTPAEEQDYVVVNTPPAAPVAAKKQWTVVNHNTKEKETLIQNADFSLTLKDARGKELWTKKMSEAIVGDVQQVDALKNGKLQTAFSTSKALHIFDRNGNEIKGFPVKLKAPVSAGLQVFDYDNNKTYRLIVGLENGDLLNYTVEGTATAGWQFANNGAVATAIKSEKKGGKDVLLVTLAKGGTRTLKRNGSEAK